MRKDAILPLWVISLFFCAACVMAQNNTEEEVSPGMETIQVGRTTKAVVPKGTKVTKRGDLVVLENPSEYVARKILDVEERVARIEAKEKELDEKIAQINRALSQVQTGNITGKDKLQ